MDLALFYALNNISALANIHAGRTYYLVSDYKTVPVIPQESAINEKCCREIVVQHSEPLYGSKQSTHHIQMHPRILKKIYDDASKQYPGRFLRLDRGYPVMKDKGKRIILIKVFDADQLGNRRALFIKENGHLDSCSYHWIDFGFPLGV